MSELNLKELGLDTLDRSEGGVAYEPALLLSAWLYGYICRIRSTRALEIACREQMGFVWLTGNRQPDHNALWRYWRENKDRIRALFRKTVKVAMDLELIGLVVQALDGTKIAAASSGRGGFDAKHLGKLLVRLDEQIKQTEREIAASATDTEPEQLRPMVRMREQIRAAMERIDAGETKHAHPLEPDAARMECDGKNRFGYNAQAVVDTKSQVIVAAEVTSQANDAAQLSPMIAEAQANCGAEANPMTLADGGYANGAQLKSAEQCGYPVLTPPPSSWRDTSDPYHAAHFKHDAARKVVTCPQRNELLYRGVRQKDGRTVEIYRNGAACKKCPVRSHCTKDRQGRTIYISNEHDVLVRTHQRWSEPATKELYGLRASTVEPVFAQVKQQMGFRRWTVRGLENVRAQWLMLAITWNLHVIMRHWNGGTGSNWGIPVRNGPGTGPRAGFPVPLAARRRVRARLTPVHVLFDTWCPFTALAA